VNRALSPTWPVPIGSHSTAVTAAPFTIPAWRKEAVSQSGVTCAGLDGNPALAMAYSPCAEPYGSWQLGATGTEQGAGMNGQLEWIGAIGAILAAALIAGDFGRRVTGWGFVLFSVVSVIWVVSGLTAKDGMPIAVQNGILLAINLYGVWQFLLSRKKKREIERAEEFAEEAKEDVEAGKA